MKRAERLSAEVEKIVDIIKRDYQPDKIILFGSFSRGNYGSDSDYDICVIKQGITHKRKMAQNIYKSLFGVGVPVDVIVETPERFDELKDNPYFIYKNIEDDGTLIYEKLEFGTRVD